jgi:hypothetical protein
LVRILLWPNKEKLYTSHYMLVAVTVACSLVGVVLWGSIVGSMLPFLLRRLGFDPAASSAPFVATLVDVTGIVLYFHLALLVLSGSLLAPSTPDVVRFESEKSADAFQRLLKLDEKWEVKRVEFYLKADKLNLLIEEGDKLGKCEACGGGLEVSGHAQPQHWQYDKVFQYPCEIESALPLLRCKKCGKIQQVSPPWEKKSKLLGEASPDGHRLVSTLQGVAQPPGRATQMHCCAPRLHDVPKALLGSRCVYRRSTRPLLSGRVFAGDRCHKIAKINAHAVHILNLHVFIPHETTA